MQETQADQRYQVRFKYVLQEQVVMVVILYHFVCQGPQQPIAILQQVQAAIQAAIELYVPGKQQILFALITA